MKIAQVCNDFLPNIGGIPVDVYEQSRRLTERGRDVTILTSNMVKGKPKQLPLIETIDGIHVKRFKVLPIKSLYKLFITPTIIFELFSIKVDVFHVFSYLPTFLTNIACVISKIRRIPLIRTPVYHPCRSLLYDDIIGKMVKIFYDDSFGLKLLKRANVVIALTQAEAQHYRERGIKNVHVIPIGVDLEKENVGTEDIEAFKDENNLNGQVILFVGRIEKRKGLEHLLKAMPIVLDSFPEARLLLVGDDLDQHQNLKKKAEHLGIDDRVISVGRVDQRRLLCAYELADVLVVPSLYEAFSRVIIEAWAHRKPVVTTKNVGLIETISGQNAIVVNYGDHTSIAKAIIKILSDKNLANKIGINGNVKVKRQFTWPKIVDELDSVYQQFLAESR